MEFNQESFSGGLNQQVDSTRINRNEYPLLINGRNRYDVIEPVYLPQVLAVDPLLTAPFNFQGLYDAGSYLIVFVNGFAYWKDQQYPDSNFNKVIGFEMSSDVEILYAELVPASTQNFVRIPVESDNKNTEVKLTSTTASSPHCLVVQDGLLQPRLILPDMTSRISQNYNEWQLEGNREYIPIGTQMMYHDGILYLVSGNLLLRSVTGRPLDFMVMITLDGDKEVSEDDGGAENVAHSVDFENITAINKISSDDGSFFVSTNKASYLVRPEFSPEDLIYGEPIYTNIFLFAAGCISPFSFIELIGDNAFVDFNGLRSFNAIEQLKNEGKNAPFSKTVGPILQGIEQDYVAAVIFDNYALFAVNTIYGRGIIIYDTLSETFVGVDIYPGVGQIKQFREVKTTTGKKLFFITRDGGLYEAFASDTVANCQIYLGDWTTNDPNVEQKAWMLKLVFIDCENSGTVYASSYVDRRFNKRLSGNLTQRLVDISQPITPPFGQQDVDTVQILPFDFSASTLQGWRHGFYITWNFKAKLSHAKMTANDEPNINSVSSQASSFARTKNFLES